MTSSSREPGLFGRLAARVASIFSFIYRLFFLLSLALGLFLAWMIYSGGPSVRVEDNVALVIAPSGALVETVDADPMQRALEQFAGEPPRQTAVRDVVDALDRAREDERIALAVLSSAAQALQAGSDAPPSCGAPSEWCRTCGAPRNGSYIAPPPSGTSAEAEQATQGASWSIVLLLLHLIMVNSITTTPAYHGNE